VSAPSAAPAQAPGQSPPATRLARPRWGDARLLLGVVLVLTSIVVGSRVVAGADHTEQVWVAATDLAAGTRLSASDLLPRAVRLGSVSDHYLHVVGDPAGSTLVRAVSAGELLPASAVRARDAAVEDRRQVTVPVAAFHYPGDLARGRLVDVYVTPGSDAAISSNAAPELLVSGALVVSVEDSGSRFGGTSASIGVVLSVAPDDVSRLVAGLHVGPVDLVRVVGP
jgi:Flp pilus assembly protein CpaB